MKDNKQVLERFELRRPNPLTTLSGAIHSALTPRGSDVQPHRRQFAPRVLVAGSAALLFAACGSSKATSSATSKAGTATTTASGAATTPAAAAGGAKLKIAFVMGCVGGEYSLGSPYQISSTFLALASASAPTFIAWKNGSDPRRRPGAGTQARRPGPCPTDPKALQSSPDEFPEEHYERAWPDRPTLDALNAIGRRGLGLAVST